MFPTGPMGFIAGFQIAVFAFVGLELVGTTAAEAQHPEKNLPKAINSIPIRIMLFYVLALVMIMTVTPWREVTADSSPFVTMFALAGLGAAAAVINFVVLTSATSSANSGLYSTSRMLFGLSAEGTAPARFERLTRHKVPANALLFSCSFLLASAVLLYANPSIIAVFTVVTTMSAVLFIFVWTIILVSYIVYRKRRPALHAASKFKMPGGVYMCYVVLLFFAFLIWALTQKTDTLQALLVTPVWFLGLGTVWFIIRRRPELAAHHELHRANVQADRVAALAYRH
jgi:D-serine/D-alanine/glycine transporter